VETHWKGARFRPYANAARSSRGYWAKAHRIPSQSSVAENRPSEVRNLMIVVP
jgi:hypothetical protein